MIRYVVTWTHDFGGSNSEDTTASNEQEAIKNIMGKYDYRYHFVSIRKF